MRCSLNYGDRSMEQRVTESGTEAKGITEGPPNLRPLLNSSQKGLPLKLYLLIVADIDFTEIYGVFSSMQHAKAALELLRPRDRHYAYIQEANLNQFYKDSPL